MRLDAVTAIRIGQQGSRRRGISLPRLALPLAIGIKDTLSHPLRFALTALGLGMAIFAMTVALALNAIVEGFSTDPKYGARPDGDLFLWRTIQYSDDEVQRLITDQPEVVASYGLVWYGFQFPGNERVYFGRFFAGDLQDFEFGLAEGRMLQNADEAVVGYAIAAQRNLHVGDSLDILIDETPATVTVTGIYHELNNEGRMIIFSLDLLQRINPKVTLTSYTLRLSPSADEESIISALTSASNYQLDIRSARETGVDNSTMAMLEMVTWLTIILTAIASLGIFNSVWMGIQERRREMALLKAIGMTPGQVVLSVLVGTGVIALCSYIVGLPVGSLCTYALTDMVGRSMGYGPLPFILKIPDLVLILPAILLIAVAGALIPARRAARTNTVAVLQYE